MYTFFLIVLALGLFAVMHYYLSEKQFSKLGIILTCIGILIGIWANSDSARCFIKNTYFFKNYQTAIDIFLYPSKYQTKNTKQQERIPGYVSNEKGEWKSTIISYNFLDKSRYTEPTLNSRTNKAVFETMKKFILNHRFGKEIDGNKIRSIVLRPWRHFGTDSTNPDLNLVIIDFIMETPDNKALIFNEENLPKLLEARESAATQNALIPHLDNFFSGWIVFVGSIFLVFGCAFNYYSIYRNKKTNKWKGFNMRKTTDKEKYFYMLSGFIMPCILTMLTLLKPRIFCTFYYLFLPLSVISVILYFIGAGIFIEGFTEKLGKYILKGKTDKDGNQKKREPNKLTCSLGHIDRFIYAFCFILKLYPALGMWFGLKVASRLVSPRESEKNKKITFKEEGERKNVYLIGNVTSLVLGLLGGVLIGILLLGVPLDSIF